MKTKQVKKIIRDSLELDDNKLDEAYVAQKKHYDLNTELLLTKTKESHDELYQAYVETVNYVSAELDGADKRDANGAHSNYRSLKVDEQYNLNSVYLHELYFANISDPYSEVRLDSLSHMKLNGDFGTFDDWQRDFIACGMSTRDGGWVVCGYSFYLKKYVNVLVDGHDQHVLMGLYPVIVLDMWEHARRDYLNNKKDYMTAMMKELNWNVIESRVKKVEQIAKILK